MYADASTDRRPVTGMVVSHASKTQPAVAVSASEAEYTAGAEGVKESLLLRNMLSFMAPETCRASSKVLEDNQGAVALMENSTPLAQLVASTSMCATASSGIY